MLSGSPGYGAAMAFDHTSRRSGPTSPSRRAASNAAIAPATTGLWKAHATLMRVALKPAASSRAMAASTAAVRPDRTVWSGAFRLATTTPSSPAIRDSTVSGCALTAAIAPGSSPAASRIDRPRARDSRATSRASHAPASASATSSP